MRTLLISCSLASCLLALAGCSSGGPTDSEIEGALKARMAESGMGVQVVSAKGKHCTATQPKVVYSCSVELEIALGGQNATRTTTATFEKTGDHWAVKGVLEIPPSGP